MYRSKPLKAMLLAVVVLTVAAATPYNTLRALQQPDRASIRVGMFVGEQVYNWHSRKWRKEAENGNVEEMYRVGSYMMTESIYHTNHIPYEPVKGKEFVVRAANEGFPPAKLKLWRMNGEQPESLVELARELLNGDVSGQPLEELTGWLHWYAKQACSSELAVLSRLASQKFAAEHSFSWTANQESFELEFSQSCSVEEELEPFAKQPADA
jgi:hypothetical protein